VKDEGSSEVECRMMMSFWWVWCEGLWRWGRMSRNRSLCWVLCTACSACASAFSAACTTFASAPSTASETLCNGVATCGTSADRFSNMYGRAIYPCTLSLNHPFAPKYSGVPPLISVNACSKNAPKAITSAEIMIEKVSCADSLRPGETRT